MTSKEMREKTPAELKELIATWQEEARVARLGLRLQTEKHAHTYQKVRRRVARGLTILQEKSKLINS